MADLPERLPLPLSERLSSASQAIYSRFGREVDAAIGGIPFMLATTNELPQKIETIAVRKDQFDAEVDPGEQTLSGWWRRSQSSFHEGAGFRYEPTTSDKAFNGYWDSEGVNVFEQGQLTLLRKMIALSGTTFSRMKTYAATPTTAVSLTAIGAGDLYKSTTDGDPTSALTVLHNPATTLVDGMVTGASFYSVASDGTLYQGTVASPGTATTWPCGTTPSRLMWGKHRLWIIGGRKLWQPDLSLAGGTAQNPIFTHPNQGWTYTCMAEGPSAMYFGGHDGNTSSIQAITLEAGGGIPTLSGATVTTVLPDGELVQEIAVLAGQYVGIGTNRGFRVGVVNSDASITYGPLIVEPAGVTGCSSVGTQGRFFVVAFSATGGKAVAYRVDTAAEVADGVFPYAKDIACDTLVGSITSITSAGDRVCCTTSDGRAWYQHATTLVDTGWLQTSRIRFRTTEPKNYKYLNVEIEPLTGSMSIDLILEGDSTLALGNITETGAVYDDPFGISVAPMKHASVKISLAQNGANQNPTFLSYLLRALPAVRPQRLITLPLLCLDKEQARSGQMYGGEGYARARLKALQILEDAAETLVYQDFSNPLNEGLMVTIESVRFIQTAPPLPHRVEGNGGILILELRTAAA